MAFRFFIEHTTYVPSRDMRILDGQLLSGEIHIPTNATVRVGSSSVILRVTSFAMGESIEDIRENRFALAIDKTDFPLDQLVGHILEEV